jgi:hypothetical protein
MKDARDKSSLKIYLHCIEEAKHRLAYAEKYAGGVTGQVRIDTEGACLQLRKAFELIALAAIAPHKSKYEAWRQQAEQAGDFRRDYHGRKILQSLAKINPYSFPRPVLPLVQQDGPRHYDLFRGEYLTKKRYEKIYDQCGRLLHADNPWAHAKPYEEFKRLVPEYLTLTKALLNLHVVIIQDENASAAWIVQFGDLNTPATGLIGQAAGEFHVSPDYYD